MMELSKNDTQKAKGVAIIGMVMLHLFCRLGNLPYKPLIYVFDIPLIYYIGLFGDICVPIYCFCSGYAHMLLKEKNENTYNQLIPERIFKFLCNYWIVVILFSVIGLIVNNNSIPGSLQDFLGNMFLYKISYNGAWWFVLTYILLLLLSPVLIKLSNKSPPAVIIVISGGVYFISYLFRFNISFDIPNKILSWIWQQLILRGTSQFTYVIGLICYKKKWISRLRGYFYNNKTESTSPQMNTLYVVFGYLLPLTAFLAHCVVQSAIVAPITAMSVFISLFILKLPNWLNSFLLFMGKHSTNIWLIHMFFYMYIFEGLVFKAKYPILILTVMILMCLIMSGLINWMYRMVKKRFVYVRS